MQQKVCLLPDGDRTDLIMKLVERISPLVAFFQPKGHGHSQRVGEPAPQQ